ncbi:hypothetical protein HNR00_002754 [Methylorubrum rhodinum]|uniref:Secreted protein n=1 Tax=Methylorubrum rhodinum TaxID=29428 RepID=A0A840ZM97_9HYPH|nr:hypothetical protein [Methylorubrum rhodinum]MBB5758037.1 hypothetical protein [Methylorubrum rhodinum]
MRRLLPLFAVLAAMSAATSAAAQGAPAKGASEPAIGCTSLANLRSLLRDTKGDTAAALATIRDPKSDLGCSTVERAAVTEITDHVSLGGRAYDCLAIKGTAVCHWVVAGAVAPPEPKAAPTKSKK